MKLLSCSTGKKSHRSSERLAPLGLIGAQLRTPGIALNTIYCCDGAMGFRGGLHMDPHDAPPLSSLYVQPLLIFQ